MLDPVGFSPEAGLPTLEHDLSQELSYADDIQLPLPVDSPNGCHGDQAAANDSRWPTRRINLWS
ncbi:hypothetical protein [Chloroflexus sp.]|uniref:hypothetical protein n=1 Tax=Chloroflexus sp. TaxID=1904827 RepID=UPI00258B9226|nr:hypothetical protein [Chloroflexus sp.]